MSDPLAGTRCTKFFAVKERPYECVFCGDDPDRCPEYEARVAVPSEPTTPAASPFRIVLSGYEGTASVTIERTEECVRLGLEFVDEPEDAWESHRVSGAWTSLSDAEARGLAIALESHLARGEVGMPSPSRAGLEQIGWYDEEEVEFRYLSQGGQPTWGEYVPVFIARSSAGSPSPAVEKLRDERNEALAELHEANRWLWLARQEGFVPNSGAELPSPEQIAAGEQAILASEDVDTYRGFFYADLTAREIAELVLVAARVSGPSPSPEEELK